MGQIMGRRGVRGAAGMMGMLLASTSGSALAQTVEVPVPQPRSPTDGNGVNLANGQLEFDDRALSIGQGQASMGFARHWIGLGWRHDYVGTVLVSGNNATVSIGDESWTFTKTNNVWSANQANGATFTAPSTGTLYTLRTAEGTVATFDAVLMANNASYGGRVTAVLVSMLMPNSERLDYAYKRDSYEREEIRNNESYTVNFYVVRLQSVRNSYGFQLKFNYASNVPSVLDLADSWSRISRVTAINNGSRYCAPEADDCGSLDGWPYLAFAGTGGQNAAETVSDALNRTTTYTRNGGRMGSVQGPRSGTVATNYIYDSNFRIQSVTRGDTSANYVWSLSGTDLTATITDALAHRQTIVTDTVQSVIRSQADALGRTDRFAYDNSGRLTSTTSRTGVVATYKRDNRGNVTQTTLTPTTGAGQATATEIKTYASFVACTEQNFRICNSPDTTTDALGGVTNYYYANGHAGAERVVRPAPTPGAPRPEVRTAWTPYTAQYMNGSSQVGQGTSSVVMPISVSICPSGSGCVGTSSEIVTRIEYNDPAQPNAANNLYPRKVTSGAGDNSLQAVSVSTYDQTGNVVAIDGPLAGSADTTRIIYDPVRQLTQVVSPDPDGAGSLKNRSIKYERNADGQVEATRTGTANADGSAFAELQAATTKYDSLGRSVAERLLMGGTTYLASETKWDTANRVDCRVQRMNKANFAPTADACHLGGIGVDGPDRVSKLIYNDADEVTVVKSAVDTGSVRQADSLEQSTQTIGRNSFGQVTSVKDANNNETIYSFDGLDRPKRTTYPDASYEELDYDAYGRVTSQRMRDGKRLAFGYDALSRQTSKNRPGDAANETNVVYVWDDLNRLVEARDSRAVRFNYGYDALGRLISDTSSNGAGTLSYQYDLLGRRTLVQWGTGSDPFVQYTRLVTGEVSQVRENGATSGAGMLASYVYDDLGRRTSLARGNGTTTTWSYNGSPWLASLGHYFPNDTAKNVTRSFTRSAAGEILTAQGSNDAYAYKDQKNADRSYVRNNLNQYSSAGATTFGYDGRGNLTNSQGEANTSYSYTVDNLLATSGGGNFVYDPLDRLLLQGASGSVLRYSGQDLLTELDQSGNVRRRWVQGDGYDEPLVQYEGSSFGDRRWYYADERGSTIATANGSGTASVLSYDEYGIPGATNGSQRFQYTGQTWLPEIGAYYYKARVYSPTLGRFLQTDPIGTADSMNMYSYVGNDPVNNVDPRGTDCSSFQGTAKAGCEAELGKAKAAEEAKEREYEAFCLKNPTNCVTVPGTPQPQRPPDRPPQLPEPPRSSGGAAGSGSQQREEELKKAIADAGKRSKAAARQACARAVLEGAKGNTVGRAALIGTAVGVAGEAASGRGVILGTQYPLVGLAKVARGGAAGFLVSIIGSYIGGAVDAYASEPICNQ